MPQSQNISDYIDQLNLSDKQYFTIEHANAALPYISKIIADITSTYSNLIKHRQDIDQPFINQDPKELEMLYEKTMDKLSYFVDELQQAGVELKDFERGLVSFPALHRNKEICLCWQHGQDQVHGWHHLDESPSSLRNLDQIMQPA